MRKLNWMVVTLTVALGVPAVTIAQTPAPSTYQGQEQREIKALSPEDVRGLTNGEGMGMAKPAELNRYPGPSHVLQLASQLNLSPEQRSAIQAIFDRMKRDAMATGARILVMERDLDQSFASHAIDAPSMQQKVSAIAALQGELRAIHLQAHLQTLPVLSMHQAHQYQTLRGYDAGGQGESAHGHSHHGS